MGDWSKGRGERTFEGGTDGASDLRIDVEATSLLLVLCLRDSGLETTQSDRTPLVDTRRSRGVLVRPGVKREEFGGVWTPGLPPPLSPVPSSYCYFTQPHPLLVHPRDSSNIGRGTEESRPPTILVWVFPCPRPVRRRKVRKCSSSQGTTRSSPRKHSRSEGGRRHTPGVIHRSCSTRHATEGRESTRVPGSEVRTEVRDGDWGRRGSETKGRGVPGPRGRRGQLVPRQGTPRVPQGPDTQ